jgi:hypothetical protein
MFVSFLKSVAILVLGTLMLGTGVCSLVFTPMVLGSLFSGKDLSGALILLLINLSGFAIAAGCFYVIRLLFRNSNDNKGSNG